MRSKLYAFILVGAAACAPAKGPEVCKPVSSWAHPVYRCSALTSEAAPAAGAPEEPKTKLESDEIKLRDKVQFETDSATLLPQSKTILDEVATILKDNPGIAKVRIDGHTDSTSTPEHNQTLSEQRANSVRDYLVSKGIATGRLTPVGHGQDKPIGDNTTDEGRFQNRRVEFHITERKP